MGLFTMAAPVGAAVGSILAGTLAKQQGWQAPFYYFAIPGIILGIMAFFMKDYKTVKQTQVQGKNITFGQTLANLFKIPTLVWALVGAGIMNIMSNSFLFWAPSFIGRAWGVDVQVANTAFVPIILCLIPGLPIGGILSDLWYRKNPKGRLYLSAITVIIGALFLMGALYFQLQGVGMILVIGYALFNVMCNPSLLAVSQDVAPVAHKGIIAGMLVFCMYALGGGWGPYVAGAISNALGGSAQALGTALTICAIGGILSGFCYLMASRSYIADMEKVAHEKIIVGK